ncbi:hypothetical protein D9M71_827880 [compost metagenome]
MDTDYPHFATRGQSSFDQLAQLPMKRLEQAGLSILPGLFIQVLIAQHIVNLTAHGNAVRCFERSIEIEQQS